MFPVLALRSGSVVLVACPLVAIVEEQVKDSVRRDLLAVHTLCDAVPQTKISVIQ